MPRRNIKYKHKHKRKVEVGSGNFILPAILILIVPASYLLIVVVGAIAAITK